MANPGSWLDIPDGSHFSLANIPFGIVSTSPSNEKHAAVAIGNNVLDLHEFARHKGFAELADFSASQVATLSQPTLNDFAALGQEVHAKVRKYLQNVLVKDGPFRNVLERNAEAQHASIFPRDQVTMHLPLKIRSYSDFFAGKNHAYNCGVIFRDPAKALQPNYLHLPVAYNSRASSVVVSGTDIHRPLGQFLTSSTAPGPSFGSCRRLDIELELGAILCKGNTLGSPIDVNEAEKYIFGFVILNDWSARDIQQWEAVPLGPFNAKTFASTISPWVVLKDALDPFRTPAIPNKNQLHPYLREVRQDNVYDINLEVELTTSEGDRAVFSRGNSRNLVYSFAQMLAHQTIGGCPVEVGDLLGSGTISGTEPGTLGSLLEASNGGKQAFELSPTIKRTFLEDGDCITMRAWSGCDKTALVGFGEASGKILPSPTPSWLVE